MDAIRNVLGVEILNVLVTLIVASVVIYFGNKLLITLIKNGVNRRLHGDNSPEDIVKRQKTLIGIFSAIFKIAVWAVAIYAITSSLKIDLSPVVAIATVIGLALSLGSQTLIKDFVLGFFIVLENQYRVGDTVEIEGSSGVVEQITLRSTILRDNDGNVHYIPNGNITQSINKTKGFSKINMLISVSASTDVDKLAAVINEVGEKMATEDKWNEKILEAPRFLNINNFTSKDLEVKVVGKITPSAQWSVKGEFRKRLMLAFKKEDIELNGAAPVTSKK